MRKTTMLIALMAIAGGTLLTGLAGSVPDGPGTVREKTAQAPPMDGVQVPFFTSFDNASDFEGWTSINNNENYTWEWFDYAYSRTRGCVRLKQTQGTGEACDNILLSPGFSLTPGFTYKLQFSVVSWLGSDLHVYLLDSPDFATASKTELVKHQGDESGIKGAEFEVPSEGIYYIAWHDLTPWTDNGAMRHEVNIDDVRLQILSNNAVPATPGDLRQVPGANGEVSMGLQWTNPMYSRMGEQLDELSRVVIMRDGKDAGKIETGVTPGAKMSWTDPSPTPGKHTYSVVVSNATGDAEPAVVETFIGVDVPGAPQNLSVDYDADGGVITVDWERPDFGAKGGWFDQTGLRYRVVRQPGNKVLATDLRDEMIEDTDLSAYGNYIYQVTTRTDGELGGTAVSAGVLAGGTATLPVFQGWENPDTYGEWTIVDNNNDGHTLYVNHRGGLDSPSAIGFDYASTNVERDESLYSPPVHLEKGKKYVMGFALDVNPYGALSMDVTYGKEKTKASQTREIYNLSQITTGGGFVPVEQEFTAAETGTFYFCWRMFNSRKDVWFDNFEIREVLDKNVAVTEVRNLNTHPTEGDEIVTGVSYINRGSSNSKAFKVQLIDDDNKVLGEQNVSRPVASGVSGNVNIKWIVPQSADRMAVRGRAVMDGDMCEADNTSEPSWLDVLPKGLRGVAIGTSSDVSTKAPFGGGTIFCQSIYKAEDFGGIAGTISSISFKVRGSMGQDYPQVPFRVYLGNTDNQDMGKGWIPANRLTKVFDGNLDMNRGVYDLVVPFDIPFKYNGGNVCLFIVSENGAGLGTYVSEYGLSATRYLPSHYDQLDVNKPDQTLGYYATFVPNVTFYVDYSKSGSISGTVKDTEGNAIEGATVKSTFSPALNAVTDKDGRYTIPFIPAGAAYLTVVAAGYQDASISGNVEEGGNTVIDATGMKPLDKIGFKGSVINAADGSPVAGATLYLKGDNELTAVTDAEGRFDISDVYGGKAYPVFTISKDGFKTYSLNYMMFTSWDGNPYEWNGMTLTPLTASPYQVRAVDSSSVASIEWDAPIFDVNGTKSGDSVTGQLGGAETLNVGHRYTPAELAAMDVDNRYFIKSISFVPMCHSQFSIAVWQGEPGKETLRYKQDVTDLKIEEWNEITLDTPFAIDSDKSVVVGYIVKSIVGAYPAGFDLGPAVEGGDCIYDPTSNEWTTARQLLPESMDYNWGIRTTFGNNPNSAPVEWATVKEEKVPAAKSLPALDEAMKANTAPVQESKDFKPAMIMLDAPVACQPMDRIPEHAEVKGYNIYRLEPGQEGEYIGRWTKLNTTPVTETNYTDETWSGIENKPYRFAVTAFYGNRSQWGDGVTSMPTFSDGVDKGRYATVTVNVSPDRGSASGTKVVITGDGKTFTETVPDGESSAKFENIRFADYSLMVLKPYYERVVTELNVDENNETYDVEMVFAPKKAEDLTAVDYIDETRLNWIAPTSATDATLAWGDGELDIAYAFSPGTEMIAGQCMRPEFRTEYSYGDFYIRGVTFYANAAVTYSPLVWSENAYGNQVEEWRQDYTVSEDEVGTWITVTLDEPLKMDPESIYYYGYAVTSPDANTLTVSIDKGPFNEEGCCFYMFDQANMKYDWLRMQWDGNVMARLEITDTPDPASAVDEDTRFDVYRLAAADSEDESKWVKVNTQPVDGASYVDKDWKDLPDQDMRYAVKSLFFGDVPSGAALSKVLPKGKVSLVDVALSTDNGQPAAGARVTFAGNDGTVAYRAESDAEGKCVIPEVVKPAEYDVKVVHPGYETAEISQRIDQSKQTLAIDLNEVKALPGYVEAYPADDNSKVDIQWRKPGAYAPTEGWAYWDDGAPYAGFGTSVGFCAVAQMFDPEDQKTKGMAELDITKISFFPTHSKSNPVSSDAYWIVKIWRVNNDMTVAEVATQNAEDVELNAWNEVVLDNPYHLDGTETLLVGYEFHGSGNALGIDNGPVVAGKGDWGNFGQGWQELTVNDGFNYNNLIHAYCDNLRRTDYEKAPDMSEPQPIISGNPMKLSVTRADRAVKAAEHKQISAYEFPVKGYRVYRLPESKDADESAWTLLTEQPVTGTSFSDNTWKNVAKGAYKWAVKAVYATGDSEAAFCQFGLDESGKVSEVGSVYESGVALTSIGNGHVLVSVPDDAVLSVDDTAGMHIRTVRLNAGMNDVDTGLKTGIYLFRVECGGESRSFKLMMK